MEPCSLSTSDRDGDAPTTSIVWAGPSRASQCGWSAICQTPQGCPHGSSNYTEFRARCPVYQNSFPNLDPGPTRVESAPDDFHIGSHCESSPAPSFINMCLLLKGQFSRSAGAGDGWTVNTPMDSIGPEPQLLAGLTAERDLQQQLREGGLLSRPVGASIPCTPSSDDMSIAYLENSAINCLAKWRSHFVPALDKRKKRWTNEEDQILIAKARLYGRKWTLIAPHLPGRLQRQCRERFVNHLDPMLRKGKWTIEEEALLMSLHHEHGNKWTTISQHMPGRSSSDVKNRWYSIRWDEGRN
jgi:Myb-like DNA-binding domain